jgi:hypothetical protein
VWPEKAENNNIRVKELERIQDLYLKNIEFAISKLEHRLQQLNERSLCPKKTDRRIAKAGRGTRLGPNTHGGVIRGEIWS